MDKHMSDTVSNQLKEGLKRTDKSYLPGKYNVWCFQFTLYQRVIWPLKMCEIISTTVKKLDARANNYTRKWLGLPKGLSDATLFGSNGYRLEHKAGPGNQAIK